MTDIWAWTAERTAAAIAAGEITSREATESCLARIDAVNPRINAIVDLRREEALEAADRADAAVARAGGAALPALHGVPVSVKINVDMAGLPTTNGVVALKDAIAPEDGTVVANLRKAGAVIVGRTNTPAFSHRWFTDNDLHGATLNPRDPGLTPGGSSGGAAAAVTAGMTPISHGNDLGGSVRYPAYACGCVGIRPTPGRVPAFNPAAKGDRPWSILTTSVQGPLTRSVEDARLGLAALSACDFRDPLWVPAPLDPEPGVAPKRIALCPKPFADVHPLVEAAIRQAGAWLEAAGCEVVEAEPPRLREAAEMWHELIVGEERMFLIDGMRDLADAPSRKVFEDHFRYAPALDAEAMLKALARRASIVRDWQMFFAGFDAALMPVSHAMPFRAMQDQEDYEVVRAMLDAQHCLLAVALTGFPGLSVPTSLTPEGPAGVQVVAQRFREDLCFKVGALIEAAAAVPPLAEL